MNLENFMAALAHHWLIRLLPLSASAVTAFLIQSTLFIALIFAADRLLRRYAASAKVLLWTCAIMLIPLLTVIAYETPPTRLNEFVGSFFAAPREPSAHRAPPRTVPVDTRDSGTGHTGSTVVNTGHPGNHSPGSALQWAVLLYCLTALALLGRISLGWIRLAQLRRSSCALRDHRSADLLRDVMGAVRYRGTCALRQSHRIESPLSFGILRPTILLPASYYGALSETELRAILLHEITHVRRRDPLRVLLIRLIESTFWFQPLVWIAGRRAEYFSELVADDAVLETGVDAGTYANVIVNLIEMGAAPKHPLHLAAGIFSAPKMLVSRIESLLDLHRAHTTRLEGRKLVVSCGILFFALAASLQLCPRPVAGAEVESVGPTGASATAADWVLIPSGNFVMGATDEQKASVYAFGGSPQWMSFIRPLVESSGPPHEVFLDSFYIFRNEVTNREYGQFAQATGRPRRGPPSGLDRPTQPAVMVTWNDARSYCAWAGARLPTEAEWEKAARGTQGFVYPWGNTWDAEKLQSMDRIARQALPTIETWESWRKQHMRETPEATTADVGSFPKGASPYGVMDMAGNVWEWVADWFDPTYYANSPRNNPKGPESGDFKVLRGGAWDTPRVVNFTWLRQTFMPPSDGWAVTGFRCAKASE
jgi:formylglycine-generating enzyme required for sulfatase activity/Zn-dependent protease with chaperone function